MTNDKIIKEFMEAKDKNKQIGVLADLNCCSKADIKAILGDHILQVKPKKEYNRKPNVVSYFNSALAMELYNSGFTDTEISDKIHTTRHKVCIWRNSNNLPNINKLVRKEQI
jgi:hypothetical protein